MTVVSEKIFEGNEFPVYNLKGCHSQRAKHDGVPWNYVMSQPCLQKGVGIYFNI